MLLKQNISSITKVMGVGTCRSYSYHADSWWECYSFKSCPSQFSGVRGVGRSNSSNHQCWHRLLVGMSHNQMLFPSVKWGIGLWVEGSHRNSSVLPRGAKGCTSNALMYHMYKWRCRGLVVCMWFEPRLCHPVVSLEFYSTLSFFTQMYKWVPATMMMGGGGEGG